jgi:quercetin dioxygenase-like cupin family protein
MNDGDEIEIGPGDAVNVPPGHDGWVVGDEPYVGIDVTGTEFAKPS